MYNSPLFIFNFFFPPHPLSLLPLLFLLLYLSISFSLSFFYPLNAFYIFIFFPISTFPLPSFSLLIISFSFVSFSPSYFILSTINILQSFLLFIGYNIPSNKLHSYLCVCCVCLCFLFPLCFQSHNISPTCFLHTYILFFLLYTYFRFTFYSVRLLFL